VKRYIRHGEDRQPGKSTSRGQARPEISLPLEQLPFVRTYIPRTAEQRMVRFCLIGRFDFSVSYTLSIRRRRPTPPASTILTVKNRGLNCRVRLFVLLALLARQSGDAVDLNFELGKLHSDGGAGGMILLEKFAIDFVHGGNIFEAV
jgi:hypothetical protein